MGTFLTAEWRKLIMAQYAVEPSVLAPWLPLGTELDFYQGRCLVSLVGFLFDRTRLKGIPIPFHTSFEEVNLRFYVRRIEPDGTAKRGVVFVSEVVPRHASTMIANALYEEPYRTLPMRRSFAETNDALDVSYGWRHGGTWYSLAVSASPEAQPIAKDSEEEFLTEHYWGYTKRSRGATSQYEVRHPRWLTYPIRSSSIEVDFGALYGPQFASLNARQPDSVLLAEGSAVSVLTGTRLISG
jgi:uncharacterized protein YqjF (DUF2071 family)